MRHRHVRTVKADIPLNDGDTQGLIERIKKARALNCDPADVGIDSCVWKRLSLHSVSGQSDGGLGRIL